MAVVGTVVGTIESLWRYPVKAMAGEKILEAFLGYAGLYGDRLFAVIDATAPDVFPYLTGRKFPEMLLYKPRFRNPVLAAAPRLLAETEAAAPGLTPHYADPAEMAVEVRTPDGKHYGLSDPALLATLADGLAVDPASLSIRAGQRAQTDCRPLSLFAIQTAQQLSRECGIELDPRRFRANIYLDLGLELDPGTDPTGHSGDGYGEDQYIGRRLQLGEKAEIQVLERDPRCKMVNLDPDSGKSNREILANIVNNHDAMAGVYGAVLVEGIVRVGDDITILD